jgi:hypothetical protein
MEHRVITWAENNGLAIVLLGATAVILLAVAPFLYGGDFWLNLVGGREIVDHGLPAVDTLTVFGQGREWVDQQWLANLTFYGLERVGGLTLTSIVGVGFVVGSFGLAYMAARWRGASQRATVLVMFLALTSATFGYSVRAQLLALPLYVVSLWLLVDGAAGIRARTFLIVPIIALWANLHGSVVLAVALSAWLAIVDVVERRRLALPMAPLLALLAAAALVMTPYGPVDTIQYYRLLLLDPPFADLIAEWKRPELNVLTAPFWFLAALTVALVIWQWRRLSRFDLGALALTLAGALSAVRGVVWFALTAVVLLPTAIEVAFRLRDVSTRPRLNRAIAALTGVVVLGAGVVVVGRGDDWLESRWPTELLPVLHSETRNAGTLVWGTDLTADWLLWHQPDLAGRIAYDVRFELLTKAQIQAISRYNAELGADWIAAVDRFDVIVLDERDEPSHLDDFLTEAGTRVAYRGERASLVVRRPARN